MVCWLGGRGSCWGCSHSSCVKIRSEIFIFEAAIFIRDLWVFCVCQLVGCTSLRGGGGGGGGEEEERASVFWSFWSVGLTNIITNI